MKRSVQDRKTHINVDIVIVTALRTPELEAVLSLPYGWKIQQYGNDHTNYHSGIINFEGSSKSVIAASAYRKGMPSSAALASKMCTLFRPRYIVMLGICAGIKGKTNIGDVIVADPTWDGGSGKQAESEDGRSVFLSAPYQQSLDTRIKSQTELLSNDQQVLAQMRSGWTGNVPEGRLRIQCGPMASVASVVANSSSLKMITGQHREALAVEMEGYAVMAATEYAINPKPTAIVIKSVCDFADAAKNDSWQEYAAYTSAAFFDVLFRTTVL